ncbi:MAG: ABC transporter permease [Acidobacteria bacterium]|nr:ABC transporter permease [Acidobacteriota bacterium]
MRLQALREAAATIARNPLRSSLAALAVAAAVATTAVVQTGLDSLARTARETSAKAFGADTFVLARIATGNLSRRELADKLARNPNITRNDVRYIQRIADGKVSYAATAQRNADVVRGPRKFEQATVNGTQSALLEIRNIDVARGRFFSDQEDTSGAPVVILGQNIVDQLFPAGDPLGEQVRIAGRAFTVVGLQARQGTAGGVSLDRYVWMPLRAFERAFGAPSSLQVFAKAPDPTNTVAAEDHARISMRARRHLGPGEVDTFDIITPEASRNFVTAITERVGAAAIPISIMALIAAIVVVTNTSLVSVTQRTHEIGIRRALGADRSAVISETIAESAMVGLIGGSVGLLVGAGVLSLASRISGTNLTLGVGTALVSLAAAILSGVAAGWYPARRAASIDVVAALRQE